MLSNAAIRSLDSSCGTGPMVAQWQIGLVEERVFCYKWGGKPCAQRQGCDPLPLNRVLTAWSRSFLYDNGV
ncbi:MAG: hypothetical protein K9K38_21130, partial [Rhodoferax sp.]|nr:hypothetical protein [Rhodoferax sp.]